MVDPYEQFEAWFAEAKATEPNDPNAMTLATATPDGVASARIVLMKGMEPGHEASAGGVVFYTNKESRKGGELRANPRAALLFHWKKLQRQVRIEGTVTDVGDAEADAYFATRARVSRLGAWASEQSRPLSGRAALEQRVAEVAARYPDEVPRPPYWSGYRLTPARFEFWQEMPFRLHDRQVLTHTAAGWRESRLYP